MRSPDHQPYNYSQNNLKDACLVASLIEKCQLGPSDTVYEIGAGKGIITQELARRCRRVFAVEIDPHLVDLLQKRFRQQGNVIIRQGDFRKQPLPRQPYHVFGNIPFNLTTEIIERLTKPPAGHRKKDGNYLQPETISLVIQKEAAERFLGTAGETLRSVLLKPWYAMQVIHCFHRSDFSPAPGVDVVLLRMEKRGPPLVRYAERQLFHDFVVYGFHTWRPTLGDIFKDIFTRKQLLKIRSEFGINLNATPSTTSFEQWLTLFACFQKVGDAQARWKIAGSEKRLQDQQAKLQKIHRTRV